VIGVDNKGYKFQRTTPTALSATEPDAPIVVMPPITHGFYKEEAVLTCTITSIIPFLVQWYRGEEKIGKQLSYV